MTRLANLARHAETLLDSAVIATSPVAGGDTCTATRLRLSDGSTALMKTHPHAPPDFFATEARGLAALRAAAAVQVPDVLAVDADCLIVQWIETGKPSGDAAAAFGAALATLHEVTPATGYGSPSDGYIGTLKMPGGTAETWAEFYADQRVRPYLALARERGQIDERDARAVDRVLGRLAELVPEEPAALLHGDLWNGNVLWTAAGDTAVIDPAVHGGHRETDLAMLALFGLPHLSRALDAYHEARPLADGWLDRFGLHQLFPLLVHAARFGGGYGARAGTIAARFA